MWKRISLLLHTIPFICPFFFLSSQIFVHRFLGSYESQSLQILYTHWKWPNILWERKTKCWALFLPSFFSFCFSRLSFQCYTYMQMEILSPFSHELKGLPSWNLVHVWTICLYFVYTKLRLLVLIHTFISFFLSLQLANIKNLYLQNCFNMSLMALAGGMWACAHCLLYFFFFFVMHNRACTAHEQTP